MSTYQKIWVSNSCGEIFIFKDVPKDEDDEYVEGWWFNNNISNVVGNNYTSCEWGEYISTKNIKTPKGGWAVEEDSDDDDFDIDSDDDNSDEEEEEEEDEKDERD